MRLPSIGFVVWCIIVVNVVQGKLLVIMSVRLCCIRGNGDIVVVCGSLCVISVLRLNLVMRMLMLRLRCVVRCGRSILMWFTMMLLCSITVECFGRSYGLAVVLRWMFVCVVLSRVSRRLMLLCRLH